MGQGGYAAYKAAGKPFEGVMTLRTDDVGMGCLFDKLNEPEAQDVLHELVQLAHPGRLDGGDDEAQGGEDPAEDRVPDRAAEPAGA